MKAGESRYSGCLYFASNVLARKMERIATKAWKPLGLSPSHGYLLLYVLDNPGTQPSVITEHLLLAPSTITRLVERLEDQLLIVRENEGKQTNIYPTQKAKLLVPKMEAAVAAFQAQYTKALGTKASMDFVHEIVAVHDKIKE